MLSKTRYCPTLELERMPIPNYVSEINVKMTLLPSVDEDGEKVKPTIIESNIIGISTDDEEKMLYDGVQSDLGDLIISHHDSAGRNTAVMNKRGELILSNEDDDVSKYSRSHEDNLTEYGRYLLYNDSFPHIGYANIFDSNGNLVTDVYIQIKQTFNDTYVARSNDNGKAIMRGVSGETYQLVLAKSGYEQVIIDSWTFVEGQTYNITYPLIEKVTWDGMYSDTNAGIYVDTHDGGNA